MAYIFTYANEQNKLTNKIETEAWIRGTEWQLSEESRVGNWMKEGEGISKKPHMPNPQTQTPAWCWPEGRGGKGGEEGDEGGGASVIE